MKFPESHLGKFFRFEDMLQIRDIVCNAGRYSPVPTGEFRGAGEGGSGAALLPNAVRVVHCWC